MIYSETYLPGLTLNIFSLVSHSQNSCAKFWMQSPHHVVLFRLAQETLKHFKLPQSFMLFFCFPCLVFYSKMFLSLSLVASWELWSVTRVSTNVALSSVKLKLKDLSVCFCLSLLSQSLITTKTGWTGPLMSLHAVRD